LLNILVFTAVVAAALGVVTFTGLSTPSLLIIPTFAMDTGTAILMLAWATIVPRAGACSHLP
jgi:hypothetical protein